MMIDLYLKTASEEALSAELLKAGFTQDEESKVIYHEGVSLDVIGVISKETGVMLTDAEGIEYPEMQAIEGWHVNLRTVDQKLADKLAHLSVAVNSPARVWA
ncbi:MAG: hypothetical protein ACRC1W_05145 [Shewanella sp.]